MSKNYSIGLDIGVASVGWACITDEFRIPKFNGRYAMGVREFESAMTAEERRLQRGTRRGYNRRIRRIQLLQQTLDPLFKEDPGFFMLTEEQEKHFWRNSNHFERNSLSETLKKLGKNPRKYPTIYHLRNDIIKNDKKKFHPRLIYLALHNLTKFRGHFLNENMTWTEADSSTPLTERVYNYLYEFEKHLYEVDQLTEEKTEEATDILSKDDITNTDKAREVGKIVGREFAQPVRLICGLNTNIRLLFPNSPNIEMYTSEKLAVNFSDDDIEETLEKLLDEERMAIEKAQAIYQEVLLKDLLGNSHYVAEAKVDSYDQFGEDLHSLKNIYNQYLGEKAYRDMFITPRKCMTEYHKTRKNNLLSTFDQFLRIHKTEDKFYRDLLKEINSILKKELSKGEKKNLEEIKDRLERNQFLQKQKGRHNAAIPHQNNMYEAERILKNQQKYYPEITDQMIDRVLSIISFRIPYYIGPLIQKEEDSEFAWAVRKSEDTILPWTIDEVINRSESAEKFISRMTSFCSYLTEEKVLPKNSLSYEMFELLNELNGVQIRPNSELPDKKYRLGMKEKIWIIENVFMRFKNVTHKRLLDELKKSEFKDLVLNSENEITYSIYGTQKESQFGTSLSTHIDMVRIFGDITEENRKMIEEIIYWISVFEEKEILELKIRENYKGLSQKQINSLLNLSYAGWGRLSKKLIDEMLIDKVNNQTMLEIMKQEPLNFMEIMSIEKYDLEKRIVEMNSEEQKKFTRIKYKDVDQLQGSPALKKGIWQAVLIVEELVDIFGEPEHIMIEFAREDGARGVRTTSRKKRINDLHRAVHRGEKELKDFLKSQLQYDEKKYNNNRLYLYITQGGKCLYSGESLDVTRLADYEVDHIYPRSFVKDDSLDNLALVTYRMNQLKGDNKMPLEVIRDKTKQKMYWKKLFDNKLISQTKYYRLMKDSFTGQDKESFFARQLVETRQITRHVRDLFNERFEHTEIHPVNANIVSNLRSHSEAIKIRDLNNKHHAVDAAFTNLIVQFIIKKYGANFLNFNFKYQEAHQKWRDMISKQRKNFFLFADLVQSKEFSHFETGELINGYQYLHMINDELPWQTTKKVGSSEAAFYDQTIYSPREIKGRNPQYQSSKLKKGVHSGLKVDSAYIISYEYLNKQQKSIKTTDVVNLLVIEKYQTRSYSNKKLALFLAEKVSRGEVKDARIHTKILKHQRVLINDHPLNFVSAGELTNGKQFIPSKSSMTMLTKIKTEEVTKEYLQKAFESISQDALNQYENYLPESRMKNISEYIHEIYDLETFNYGLEELFKMSNAGAQRSNLFGGRYERKLNPEDTLFIYESITGLRYRKPKSYKNELWST